MQLRGSWKHSYWYNWKPHCDNLVIFVSVALLYFSHLFIGNVPLASVLKSLFFQRQQKIPSIPDIVLLYLIFSLIFFVSLLWPSERALCNTGVVLTLLVTSQEALKKPNSCSPTAAVALLMCLRVSCGGGKKSSPFSLFSTLLHFLSKWLRWDLQLIMCPRDLREGGSNY